MAAPNLTSLTKLNTYAGLFQVNRALRNACIALHQLEATGMFNQKALKTYRGLTRELQAQINCELLETLRDVEERESGRLGKVRVAWEKWLKGE